MMKAVSVFSFRDYKEYLKNRIRHEPESWGLITRLAKAAGCQRTYLSRALNGPTHLTPDQVFGLSAYWQLSPDETEGLFALLEIGRTASASYRAHLESKFAGLKRRSESLSRRMKKARLPGEEHESTYYSSWHWCAVHILVSIPEFQTPGVIARKLGISEELVLTTLQKLEAFGLVKKLANGKWVYGSAELYLPGHSPLIAQHHANWRARAVLDSQLKRPETVHYTMVQSMSVAVREQLRLKMLEFIAESAKIAGPSDPEVSVCIACDFFD